MRIACLCGGALRVQGLSFGVGAGNNPQDFPWLRHCPVFMDFVFQERT